MANAPIPVNYSDAPEAYQPAEHHVPHYSAPVSPNSPPPQYGNEGMHPADNRYSTYKGAFVPTTTPVTMGDAEAGHGGQAAVAAPPKRLRERRVCGIPMLWFIAVVALLIIGVIVGGVLGGVLGSKKKSDPAPVLPAVVNDPEPEPTPEEDPTTTSSTSSSGTPTPTPKIPTGITEPRIDSWYYIKNKLVKPENELVLEVLVQNDTAYLALDDPKGDPFELWGFWPAKRNSSRARQYQDNVGLKGDLYIVYNRGLVQRDDTPPPTDAFIDDQQSWWWIEENPNGGVYIKGGYRGPDYAYTVTDHGTDDIDMFRFEPLWNRTSNENETIVDAQIWSIELAYAFLEGEKSLWDSPAANGTAA